jgi:tRNA modification GTPase
MKIWEDEDTIIALSTPVGRGALAIIRLSGPNSLAGLNQIFSKRIRTTDHRRAVRGEIYSQKDQKLIDQCVVTYYRSPNSYTGDDLMEITCHCNSIIIDQILQEFISMGLRLAQPGEFSKRAFLNHKMDLSQAEAVASVIEAKTRQGLYHSLRQLEGVLSQKISDIKHEIIDIASLIEVSLDFNEDDIEVYDHKKLITKTEKVIQRIDSLIYTYQYGRLLNEGVKLLILGKPNVGKSSLLNVLLVQERAIVSEIPGTTRDYIEGYIQIDGIPMQIVDTAGIRDTISSIEEVGVQRSLKHMESSDIILAMFEIHKPLDQDDLRLVEYLESYRNKLPIVVVLNKLDLGCDKENVIYVQGLGFQTVQISAKGNQNIDILKEKLKKELVTDSSIEQEEVVVTNSRHKTALQKTQASLHSLINGLEEGTDEVILATEVRSALDFIGEIAGETSSEDVLNNIFSQFCVGK